MAEITIHDLQDKLTRDRKALGFIADKTDDPQLSSLLAMLEESMGVSETMVAYLLRTE